MYFAPRLISKSKKRPRRLITATTSLPENLVCEILTRLPVKTLLRFKSVCKPWHALITDPYLVQSHLHHHQQLEKVLILPRNFSSHHHQISFYSYHVGSSNSRVHLLFGKGLLTPQPLYVYPSHCNGLVLIFTHQGTFVCNPSTRKSTILPKGSYNVLPHWCGVDRAAIGYVPRTKEYKVARYFYRSFDLVAGTGSIGFEVLTLGGRGNLSWRTTKVDPPYQIRASSPASVNGFIYWKISNELHTASPKGVLGFDLDSEEFKVIPMPPSHQFHRDGVTKSLSMNLVELQGHLCCYGCPSGDSKMRNFDIEIWMFMDRCTNSKATWIKSYAIKLPLMADKHILPLAVHDGHLLMCADDVLYSYDPSSKLFKTIVRLRTDLTFCNPREMSPVDTTSLIVIPYVESLVSFGGARVSKCLPVSPNSVYNFCNTDEYG